MQRINTTGHKPIIEYRPSVAQHFVVFPDLGVELAPSFMLSETAWEIAVHASHGTPFYQMIPCVPYRTPWPRPNMVMPKLSGAKIDQRTRDYGD